VAESIFVQALVAVIEVTPVAAMVAMKECAQVDPECNCAGSCNGCPPAQIAALSSGMPWWISRWSFPTWGWCLPVAIRHRAIKYSPVLSAAMHGLPSAISAPFSPHTNFLNGLHPKSNSIAISSLADLRAAFITTTTRDSAATLNLPTSRRWRLRPCDRR
jgi:hypothetical protein